MFCVQKSTVTAIEKQDNGNFVVKTNNPEHAALEDIEKVIFAIGRVPNTQNLGLVRTVNRCDVPLKHPTYHLLGTPLLLTAFRSSPSL
jgi:hypothetical protein